MKPKLFSCNHFLFALFLLVTINLSSNAQTTRLWSMTNQGGANSVGTIISYDPANGDELVQYSFTTSVNNYYPYGSLVDYNGKLYGLTSGNALFSFDPSTGKDSVLHTFGQGTDGGYPTGSLVVYNSKFYGMTSTGGANNSGVIFSYAPSTGTYTKLYDFDANFGGSPHGSFVVYNNLLWGLALSSFVNSGHNGCIFSFDPATNIFSDKYNFQQFSSLDGTNPYGELTLYNNLFYGLTAVGGTYDFGTLFSFNPSTNACTKLHDFNAPVFAPAVNGPTGNVSVYNGKLYGMCPIGGLNPDGAGKAGYGYIFSYDPSNSTFSELYDFDGTNGRSPKGSLLLYNSKFYGMTSYSGNSYFNGPGVIFSFDPSNNSFSNLVNFNGTNGQSPQYSSFFSFSSSNTQTVATGSVSGPFCSGTSLNVSYTVTGTFTNGNVFTAQLSDSSGHFSNAVNIGFTTSVSGGTIAATLPVNTLTSSHYRIRVISSTPAVAGSDNGVNITINQTATPVITPSGSATVCSGNPVTLLANTGVGYSYQWKLGGNNISGATNSSYSTSVAGSYTVTETFGTCSVTSATPTVLTVDSYVPTITPSGTVNICNSSSLLLQTIKVTGYTYQWRKNGSDIVNATAFKYTATSAGTYTVRVNDGSCTPISAATTITMSAPPAATITPSGNVNVCTGNTAMLQANTGIGFTYQWMKNGSNIASATSSSYVASTAASYTVAVSLGQCSATSSATVLTVSGPSPTVSPSGTVTVCPAVTVNLSANSGAGLTYQWLKSGVALSGATQQNYSTSVAGIYSVKETNTNGCTATSANTTTKNFKVKVKITNTGNLNICSTGSVTLNAQVQPGYTYQWYNNSAAISGATGTSYIATTAGVYKYLATTPDGCTKYSATKTVSGCKVAEATAVSNGSLTLYPNPAHDEATIELVGDDGDYEIELLNLQGQLLMQEHITVQDGSNSISLDLSTLPAGLYVVKATNSTTQHTCLLSKE